ncbi:MAG: hypothetical protein KDE45_04945 [Caldilineaceae bacterium]|nr:hypothetical protein [Caldilineaceae bacterium]
MTLDLSSFTTTFLAVMAAFPVFRQLMQTEAYLQRRLVARVPGLGQPGRSVKKVFDDFVLVEFPTDQDPELDLTFTVIFF